MTGHRRETERDARHGTAARQQKSQPTATTQLGDGRGGRGRTRFMRHGVRITVRSFCRRRAAAPETSPTAAGTKPGGSARSAALPAVARLARPGTPLRSLPRCQLGTASPNQLTGSTGGWAAAVPNTRRAGGSLLALGWGGGSRGAQRKLLPGVLCRALPLILALEKAKQSLLRGAAAPSPSSVPSKKKPPRGQRKEGKHRLSLRREWA